MSDDNSGGLVRLPYARWKQRYRFYSQRFLRRLKPGEKFTGEDIRFYIERRIGKPLHHNSWGIMARHTLARWEQHGAVHRTKGWRAMKDPRAHRRSTRVYKRDENPIAGLIRKIFG